MVLQGLGPALATPPNQQFFFFLNTIKSTAVRECFMCVPSLEKSHASYVYIVRAYYCSLNGLTSTRPLRSASRMKYFIIIFSMNRIPSRRQDITYHLQTATVWTTKSILDQKMRREPASRFIHSYIPSQVVVTTPFFTNSGAVVSRTKSIPQTNVSHHTAQCRGQTVIS